MVHGTAGSVTLGIVSGALGTAPPVQRQRTQEEEYLTSDLPPTYAPVVILTFLAPTQRIMSSAVPAQASYTDAPPDFDAVTSGPPGIAVPTDAPPDYQEKVDDPDEILQPINYVMHGRFIYASPNETSPLYELSRVIHAQGEATTNIEFHRLDYRVRTRQDGTPNVAHRSKHVYNISHLPIMFCGDYQCHLQSLSRKALGGHMVLKKAPFPHSGFRATLASEDEGGKGKKRPKNEYFFWLKLNKTNGTSEWYDWTGRMVATQVEGMHQGQPEFMLMVLEPLTRRMMDGLVAFWCLWLWHMHASNTVVKKGKWQEIKEFMEKPRTAGYL
ncbi:hypothetical protein QBC34DRAFT_144461 [Podospora aff. communis PSN243]|uniref:Uncharacterized protein n=1 Tax=Podospora aff. communis PSN243 TaxID=3040156 RepID=A0AAV9GHX3_9PEZI|nr:hypothetical protein QBC34DRAFT_144461 [Podospora aff. communis PSN243]